MTVIQPSWGEYYKLIEGLSLKVNNSGIEFDYILCLARGGIYIGDAFSRIFKKPAGIMFASSYLNNVRGNLEIGNGIAMKKGELQGNILIVDDMVDSGETLKQVVLMLRENPKISNVHTAVIWKKEHTVFIPDFYYSPVPSNCWIEQPFEYLDNFNF